MKTKLFVLLSLPLVFAATGCGKKDDAPVVATAPVAAPPATTCASGMASGPQGCYPVQYGQPPSTTYPVNGVQLPQGQCPQGYWAYPYGPAGSGAYRCYPSGNTNNSGSYPYYGGFRWYYWNGFYYYVG